MKTVFVTAFCAVLGCTLSSVALSTAYADETAQEQSAQPGTDTWITTKVKAELMATKGISSTEISVNTTNGIVTLSGALDSKVQVEKAVAVTRAVKGVHDVDASALKSRN